MRYAEHITSDAEFLRLFSPGVLDALPREGLWDRPTVTRSAPGGGKTSLLRLFRPESLLALHALRRDESCEDLYTRVKRLGALRDEGPCVLGPMLSHSHGYASLEDLDADNARKDRVFLSLVNARIVLCALRSALVLQQRPYPQDLASLSLECAPSVSLPKGVPYRGSGQEFHDWATEQEANVCEAVDSLRPSTHQELVGHDTLFALWLLNPETFLYDGRRIAERVVVMLDDVHKLAKRQRRKLLELLADLRAPVPVWVAERLEALTTNELLSEGNVEGRDWHLVHLESYWSQHRAHFETFARDVANRRASAAADDRVPTFSGCLQDSIDGTEWRGALDPAREIVVQRVRELAGGRARFGSWIRNRGAGDDKSFESLVAWRVLEVLMRRDLSRTQKTFDFELTDAELATQDQAEVRQAAEFLLHKEFKLPHYFGFSRLCQAASWNVEQFQELAAGLFQEVLGNLVLSTGKAPEIKADRQERILQSTIRSKWDEIARRVASPTDVRSILEAIGAFCRSETLRPTAPYAPGVTGIAIRMADRERLRDSAFLARDKECDRLARTLTTCLSHNLLEPIVDQKCKGERWMVFYLNRMLCVQFGLPLGYGGWRPKTLRELCLWLEKGFRPRRTTGDLL
jgi:hypothetical protein